jgi:hypothetical protein
MIIICDITETCSYDIIFEILLIWLPATQDCLSAWVRKPACLSAEKLSACLRKPDCPSAEICLIVCANQVDYLRKPGQDACLCKPDTYLANLRCLSAQNCLCKTVIRDIGCPSAQIWLSVCANRTTCLANLAAFLRKICCIPAQT